MAVAARLRDRSPGQDRRHPDVLDTDAARIRQQRLPITGLPPNSACFVVAGGRDATIVAFSGTDPLKIEDWITDFNVQAKLNVLHQGYKNAVETVWPKIKATIESRPASEQNLFFTGHSLGGALAVIAASARPARSASSADRGLYIRRPASGRPDLLRSVHARARRAHVPFREWRRHRPDHSVQRWRQLPSRREIAPLRTRLDVCRTNARA